MFNIGDFTIEGFIYKYSIFLFFIVFLIGLGAGTYIGGNIGDLEAPVPNPPVDTGSGFLDWLTNTAGSMTYFFDNIVFFFTLMSVDAGIGTLGILIFSPAVIVLLYAILKLIRGT